VASVFSVTAAQCTVLRGFQAPAFLVRAISVRKTDCKKMIYCIARRENQILKFLEFIIINDDQQDATILGLFISSLLYMFQAIPSPIIRST
jgi:hypothetical protein